MTLDDDPPSWAGAPGFVPDADNRPPHAPMPGAPPYPAAVEHPPPPVGVPPARTGFLMVLAAAAVWAVVNAVVVLIVDLPPVTPLAAGLGIAGGPATAIGLGVTVVVTAAAVWAAVRGRGWSPGVLLLVTAPVFWVLRAVTADLLG